LDITEIVKFYISNKRLSLRDFAKELSENIENDLSHATIINWRDKNSSPDTNILISLALAYNDWRQTFALDILFIKYPMLPDLFEKLYRELIDD